LTAVVLVPAAALGTLLAARRPRNPLGWILLAILFMAIAPAAALFNPLRRRVQHAVDRRFNRARYNADQAVAAFAARLKGALDLDSVRDDLAGVVNQALEPAHISVWIRAEGRE
jgi:hypothetical protein